MKRSYILFIFSILLFCCNTSTTAQNNAIKKDSVKQYMGVSDSLGYMTEIAANKQKYINQPLSVLIKDLKIPVKSYYPSLGSMSRVSSMIVSFDVDSITIKKWFSAKGFNPHIGLIIGWKFPLTQTADWTIIGKGDENEWVTAVQNYYSDKIISDILIWSVNEK